jgi:hypothetical protein
MLNLNPNHYETLFVVAAGVLTVIVFDSTIAGFLNPLLAPLKLSYS